MVDAFAAIQPSVGVLWIHDLSKEGILGPMDGSNTVIVGTASGVVKARTTKRLSPGERWTGSLLDEALGSELTPPCTGRRWLQSRDQSACVATTCGNSCTSIGARISTGGEHHCAEPTSSSLATQTIALDAQMQEQVVNKWWIIQNSAVPAWKQF